MFMCKRFGLISDLKNRFSEQQELGQLTVRHNVLSRYSVETILTSNLLSEVNLEGF